MGERRGSSQARRRVRPVLLAAAMALVVSGCGTRLTHEHLVASWKGPAAPAAAVSTPATSDATAPAPAAVAGVTPEGAPAAPAAVGTGTVPGSGTVSSAAAARPGSSARSSVASGAGGAASAGASGGGSSSASGSTGGAGSTPNPGGGGSAPQTGAPVPAGCSGTRALIAIGNVGQNSGILGAIFFPGAKTVQTWVASVNARGGLKCHPVKYLIEDDGGDPSRHQALVRKLVEQDHILAFVFMDAALTGAASQSYITEKQIPVIGSELGSEFLYTSPMYFPQATGGYAINLAIIAQAADAGKAAGKTKAANLTCIEATQCSRMYDMAPRVSEFGMTSVYRAQASLAQPDYTSQCQSAQSAGAEVLIVTLDGNSLKRVLRSCNSVNYHPLVATTATAVPEADTTFDGVSLQHSEYPWFLTDNPAVVEYQETLKRYSPGLKTSATGISGWISAKVFELAAAGLSEPPTSQSLLEGLWTIKDNDMGGMTQPLTFTRGQPAPRVVCYWGVMIKGNEFVSTAGHQRACLGTLSE